MGWMNWIDLAQDRDQWRALLNTIMNYRLHKMSGEFLSGWWVLKKGSLPWNQLLLRTNLLCLIL
jgi:hypothetical protein